MNYFRNSSGQMVQSPRMKDESEEQHSPRVGHVKRQERAKMLCHWPPPSGATAPVGHNAQARKRHMNINLLLRLALGRPRACPSDKPRFSPYLTQWKRSLSQWQTQFVPGTNPGSKGARKSLCEVLVAFS